MYVYERVVSVPLVLYSMKHNVENIQDDEWNRSTQGKPLTCRVTSGVGSAYCSGAPEFTPGF